MSSHSSTTTPDAAPALTPDQGLALNDCAFALAQATERDDIARLIARHGLAMLRAQRCTLFSYDPVIVLLPDLSGQAVPESALPTARWPAALPPFMERAVRERRATTWSGVEGPLDTAARDFARRAKLPPAGPSADVRAVRERLGATDALAALCVPLIAGGELSGLAVFHDNYPREWPAAEVSLAERLGQLSGATLRTARRFERERRRRRVAEGLAEVASSVTATLDLEIILGHTARYAAELLAAPLAGIVVLDKAIATAPSAHFGPLTYGSMWSEAQRTIEAAGWLDHLAGGEVISLANTATERIAGEWFREHGVVSLLLAPLVHEGRLVAMLGVAYTDSPHRFSRPEIELVRQFAQQTALAIANADTFRRQRRRAEQMRSLAEVSAALASTLDLDKVLKLILDQLRSVVAFDSAAIEELDGETLAVVAESGDNHASPAQMRISVRDNALARRVLEERRPVILGDVQRHPDFIRMDRRVRSWIGVPLLAANQPIGLLVVDSYQSDRYNEEDGEVVAAFARQAALAMDRARLFAAERAGRRQAALLLEMTRAVSASLDLDEVLTRAARDIAAAAGVVHCGVYLVDKRRSRLTLRGSAGRAPRAALARPALLQSLRSLGEPLVLDPLSDGRIDRSVAKPMNLVSLLAVPFIHREQLVGVALAAAYERPVQFERGQVTLAHGIARSAAVAIENAALYQEQERRVAQLSALNEIGQAAAALLRHDEVINLICQQTSQVLKTQSFYIAILADDRDRMTLIADTDGGEVAPNRATLVRGEGLTWHVVDHQQPLYVRDGYAAACERLGITTVGRSSRSWLGVPLLAGGRALGAIVVQDYDRDDAYDDDDVAVLTTIASQAAIALENARLFSEVQQRVQQLIGIASVGAAIVEERDVDRVLAIVGNHLRGLTDAETVLLSFLSEDAKDLRVWKAVGQHGEDMQDIDVPVEGSLAAVAIATRESQVSSDPSDDPRVYAPNVQRYGVRNLLIVPLVAQDRVIGTITAINKRGGVFGQGDIDAVEVMANLAAVAFENARLYGLTQQRSLELKALNEIGQRISRSLALDAVLDAIVSAAVQLLAAEKSVLFLIEDERLLARASHGLEIEMPGIRFEARDSVAGYVARTGFPIIVHDIAQDGRVVPDMADAEDIRSLVEVPIRMVGAVAGGVLVVGSPRVHAFSDSQVELLSALADQAAIAIDNARLYAQARELAVLEERNRMAREMHDTLAQGFTGIVLQLEAAEQVLGDDVDETLEHLSRARQLARDSLNEARRSVWNLRPRALEQATLADAIRQSLDDYVADGRIEGSFAVEGTVRPLPAEAENTLLRIAQESLTNLRKHAHADHVWVALVYGSEIITLTIRDDGVGFDPSAPPASRHVGGGLGLVGMRERAQAIGAHVQVDSQPGEGAQILVSLPVRSQ